MSLRNEFRVGVTTTAMAFGQDCKALIPEKSLDPVFFAYAVKSRAPEVLALVDRAGHGTGRLGTQDLQDVTIPVPPMEEQKAIAHVLRTAQQAKDQTEEVISSSRELKASLIESAFGDPALPTVALIDVCDKPQYGFTASASRRPIGPRFLRITDIQDGTVDWAKVPFADKTPDDFERYRLATGDLVVARIGATTGKAYRTVAVSEPAIFASYLIRVRPRDIEPGYLNAFFQSSFYWSQVNAQKGSRLKGGINSTALSQLRLPLPEHREQTRITQWTDVLDQKIRAEHRRLDALDQLFGTLLRELMTGERPVNHLLEVG